MLRSIDELRGYVLLAQDGEIGRCEDFLFEDASWVMRYMVADTRKWLPGRKVLVSPIALGQPDWIARAFPVRLTKEQIRNSPPLEEDEPVSRQYEAAWTRHYGWPYYWTGGGIWGSVHFPGPLYAAGIPGIPGSAGDEIEPIERTDEPDAEADDGGGALRSEKEVRGYHIRATDGEIGRVRDLVVEDDTWIIRYVVIDTHKIFPGGREVLVSPSWIESVDWASRSFVVGLTMQQVKDSPEYDPSTPINRINEERLYDYHGRPRYWI